MCSGYAKCNVDNTLEDAVNWIGGTPGSESENRQALIDYLQAEHPGNLFDLDIPNKLSAWLVTEVYMIWIMKTREGPDLGDIKQTPSLYLKDLLHKLQGVETDGMTDLQLVQHYCR